MMFKHVGFRWGIMLLILAFVLVSAQVLASGETATIDSFDTMVCTPGTAADGQATQTGESMTLRVELFGDGDEPLASDALNYDSGVETADVEPERCPIFNDSRINDCDTFNPVVLYGTDNGNAEWGLDVYAADGSGLLLRIPVEDIAAVPECPEVNTPIFEDHEQQIYVYRLSTCQYYLRAPMSEPGKWYTTVFDDLYPHCYYESWTEFIPGRDA